MNETMMISYSLPNLSEEIREKQAGIYDIFYEVIGDTLLDFSMYIGGFSEIPEFIEVNVFPRGTHYCNKRIFVSERVLKETLVEVLEKIHRDYVLSGEFTRETIIVNKENAQVNIN